MRKIHKILIHLKTKTEYLVKDLKEDFHTQYGVIKAKELNSKKRIIESNKNDKFILINPSFPDLWKNLTRGPQVMLQKDIGLIIAKTGINKDSKIVDAGGGSGSLSFSLANICKEITVYEVNPEHYKILSKNVKLFGLENLKLKQDSVYDGIKEKKLDLITLDLPEPWRVTLHAQESLQSGGFLIVYLPNLNQMKQFIESTRKTEIKVLETIELIERKWKIEEKIMRPEFNMLGHTGFLTFCRRI
jgi:tRNA (adenine57-N1/adenine58-N1)-methyltransferase catalytic subunit